MLATFARPHDNFSLYNGSTTYCSLKLNTTSALLSPLAAITVPHIQSPSLREVRTTMLLVPTTGEQDDNGESSHYTPLSLNLVEGASPSPSKTYSSSSSGVVELVLQLSRVRGAAERFAADDVRVIEVGTEVLSVIQGEVAAAQPDDGSLALGSDSATTCHIVAFRNPSTGRTCLAHLDSSQRVAEAVGCMLALVCATDGGHGPADSVEEDTTTSLIAPLDVYIVGGYLGEPLADELSHTLLATLHKSRYAFRLVLACIAGLNSKWLRSENGATTNNDKDNDNNSMNNWNSVNPTATTTTTSTSTTTQSAESHSTTPSSKPLSSIVDACCDTAMSSNSHGAAEGGDGWLPRRTSLAVDVASGRAFPVRFEGAGRGPGFKVRHARIFAGDREHALAQVYDAKSDSIVISPFSLWMDPQELTYLLALPDQKLVAITSTSPETEDPRFVQDVRAQFSFILRNIRADGQGWLENVFGGAGRDRSNGGKPLVYPRGSSSDGSPAVPES